MNKVRFAQLSFWFGHAYGMCAAAQKHPGAELVCVWDADEVRGRAAAERYGVPYVADLNELLGRDDIDAVGICSETQLHADHIERAAAAGKHCLVEKPFTRTIAQADAAIVAAEAAGIHVMPAYTLRFSPANERMKQIVDAGTLGPLYQVRRRHGQPKYRAYNYDADRITTDPNDLWIDADAEARNCLLHAGSHAFYWMLWMFGMPESVVSLSATRVPGLPVHDQNVSVFQYADGPLVTLQSSQTENSAPLTTEIYGFEGAVVQTRGDSPSTRSEFAELGTLMMYLEEEGQWQSLPDLDRSFVPPGANPPYHFFDALLAGEPMPVSMYEGKRCVLLLAAAERAQAERRQVEISELL
jgi:predicted dehydrogenase